MNILVVGRGQLNVQLLAHVRVVVALASSSPVTFIEDDEMMDNECCYDFVDFPAACLDVPPKERYEFDERWILRHGPRMNVVMRFLLLVVFSGLRRRVLRCNRKGIGLRIRRDR